MREYEPQYDAEKLKELILYVADRSRDDLNFGAVKLNKILYYADFYAYRRLGHPITGAEYQKLQEGPAPRQLLPVRRELLRDELIAIEHRQVFNHVQERVVPKSRYRQSVLTDEELTLADEVLSMLRFKTGRETSEMSHLEPGWKAVDFFETIPYSTAWLAAEPLTQDQVERARRVAERYELSGT